MRECHIIVFKNPLNINAGTNNIISFTGKVDANTMLVMDSFALPVEGTETRVNAQAQAYEYMTAYIEAAKQVKYHSLIMIA